MKAHVIAIGLALASALATAGGAAASTWHWAQASTKEDAMRAASAEAEAKARRKGTCYKPAATLDKCRQTADGFSCRADSADIMSTCLAWDDWVTMPIRLRPMGPVGPFPEQWFSARPQSVYPSTYVSYPYAPGVYVPPPPFPSQ
ncbi:hypothetical protein DMC25_22735 [Caulobacter sp. D4A]|uniref:hypothetical protein n=1 Tax=unclassified Caulobacter TaxID=2648921 RepID=UPI000D73DDDE|nr:MULTISPECIES: hypothetical protein [unclassified Caulobacter]PXA78106.1 hypothetical protein DMC25_22735 [Caulobacter sp. D4A]PXA92730.1 hypothetical protein DMC18_10310 [Caulobacter sp. D5]